MHLVSKIIVLGAVLSSLAAGCGPQSGDPSPTGQSSMSLDQACATLCKRDLACDSSVDTQVCVDKCMNAQAVIMPKLRSDLVSATISCYQAADCASVLTGKAWKNCVSTSEASIAPSGEAQTFCTDLVAVAKKCSSTADEAACLESAKIFNDGALSEAASCTQKGCSEVNDCIKAALP